MNNEETSLVRQSTVIAPRTLAEVVTLAEQIAKSGLLPKELQGKVPEVMMQIMAGQELGLAPMASLRSFSIITGKPVMSADAMVAIVLGSGKCEYFERVSESDKEVTYATKRVGRPERRCQWTMEMAKQAALHQKDNWRTFPRAMLASRAKSELARDVYSDILAGVYSAEEIEQERQAPPVAPARQDVVDAEFREVPADAGDSPEVLAIDTMESVEALKAHGKIIAGLGLTGPAAMRASDKYKARMGFLKSRPTSSPTSNGGASGFADKTGNGSSQQSDASTEA